MKNSQEDFLTKVSRTSREKVWIQIIVAADYEARFVWVRPRRRTERMRIAKEWWHHTRPTYLSRTLSVVVLFLEELCQQKWNVS